MEYRSRIHDVSWSWLYRYYGKRWYYEYKPAKEPTPANLDLVGIATPVLVGTVDAKANSVVVVTGFAVPVNHDTILDEINEVIDEMFVHDDEE